MKEKRRVVCWESFYRTGFAFIDPFALIWPVFFTYTTGRVRLPLD